VGARRSTVRPIASDQHEGPSNLYQAKGGFITPADATTGYVLSFKLIPPVWLRVICPLVAKSKAICLAGSSPAIGLEVLPLMAKKSPAVNVLDGIVLVEEYVDTTCKPL
jgi:hypothetical protein